MCRDFCKEKTSEELEFFTENYLSGILLIEPFPVVAVRPEVSALLCLGIKKCAPLTCMLKFIQFPFFEKFRIVRILQNNLSIEPVIVLGRDHAGSMPLFLDRYPSYPLYIACLNQTCDLSHPGKPNPSTP